MRFRPDVDLTPEIIRGPSGPNGQPGPILGEQRGKSGVTELAAQEVRVLCRRCGSPAVASFDENDEKYGAEIPGFSCQAGDCQEGHDDRGPGVAIRRG